MAENTEKEIKVKSLQKALDILNCFTKREHLGRNRVKRVSGSE